VKCEFPHEFTLKLVQNGTDFADDNLSAITCSKCEHYCSDLLRLKNYSKMSRLRNRRAVHEGVCSTIDGTMSIFDDAGVEKQIKRRTSQTQANLTNPAKWTNSVTDQLGGNCRFISSVRIAR